jgi:nucleotide-binding universal stress UspA family protein
MATSIVDRFERITTAARHAGKERANDARSLRILAVVDGTECTGRVMNYLLGLQSLGIAFDVVLVNTQPQPEDWRLRGYGWFKREEIRERIINDLARPAITSAGRQLDGFGIAHKDRIELGEASDTILRCARDEACDLIVIGEPRPGRLHRWLLQTFGVSIGSVATVVVACAHVPVVVAR